MRKSNRTELLSVDMVSHTEREYQEEVMTGRDKYVKYGAEDDLPQYLTEIYESSPIHGALVNSIADMIYGDGLESEEGEVNPRIQDWLGRKTFGQDGQDTLRYICLDLKKNGISFVEVIQGQGQISTLFRSEPEFWRLGEKDDNREIKEVWYSEDFGDPYKNVKPDPVPVWKPGTKEQRSVLVISLPCVGHSYYPRPDYYGGAKYAELDKEIGSFHLNHIMNGMAPSMAINFNNGIPETKEKRQAIKKEVQKTMQGTSNAGKIFITFNEGKERAAEFTTFDLSEAHLQYDQLARTVVHQILVAHRVISPMLHGVRDYGTGFSNNADELAMATRLFERNVILPFRRQIEKALSPVFEEMGQQSPLYFVSPELESLTGATTEEKVEEEILEQRPTQLANDFTEDEGIDMLLGLSPNIQLPDDNWELVESHRVEDDGNYKLSNQRRLEGFFLSLFDNRGAVNSKPTKASKQDSGVYKVRYAYMPVRKSSKSRDFCKALESITERGGVFRIEDITNMSRSGVNKSHGHKGKGYNLFLYKGGVNCHHFWERRIYKEKVSKDNQTSVNKARGEGFKPETNDSKVAKLPVDMPRNGHHPDWKP
jgi:hypothetical protein